MKLLVVFTLVVLCTTHVVCLTIEEQNKLLAELNKDRQEVAKKTGIKFEILTYSTKLENKIDEKGHPCMYVAMANSLTLLRRTDVTYRLHSDGTIPEIGLFLPSDTEIGCVKDFACSKIATYPKEFNGTHVQYNGACMLEPQLMQEDVERDRILATGLPRPDKYGELIGVGDPSQVISEFATTRATKAFTGNEEATNSSGNILSIFLSLFIVFYF